MSPLPLHRPINIHIHLSLATCQVSIIHPIPISYKVTLAIPLPPLWPLKTLSAGTGATKRPRPRRRKAGGDHRIRHIALRPSRPYHIHSLHACLLLRPLHWRYANDSSLESETVVEGTSHGHGAHVVGSGNLVPSQDDDERWAVDTLALCIDYFISPSSALPVGQTRF